MKSMILCAVMALTIGIGFAQVNAAGIHEAVACGNTAKVQQMIYKDATLLSNRDNEGYTPLIRAIYWDEMDILKYLLEQPSIDVNIQDEYGSTALIHAAVRSLEVVVKQLINANADVNIKSKAGNTALIKAVIGGPIVVDLLLQAPNIDVNAQNLNGKTALMAAAYHDRLKVAEQLLAHPNIDVDAIDSEGRSALDIATNENHKEIVKLIEEYKQEQIKNYKTPW